MLNIILIFNSALFIKIMVNSIKTLINCGGEYCEVKNSNYVWIDYFNTL